MLVLSFLRNGGDWVETEDVIDLGLLVAPDSGVVLEVSELDRGMGRVGSLGSRASLSPNLPVCYNFSSQPTFQMVSAVPVSTKATSKSCCWLAGEAELVDPGVRP